MKAMLLHSSRSLRPAGGGSTPKTASQALAAARWCDHGQTPQMRGVMRGMSSTGRPMQKLSNPRNSMTFTRARSTLPVSSSWMVILAWPSMRVTG